MFEFKLLKVFELIIQDGHLLIQPVERVEVPGEEEKLVIHFCEGFSGLLYKSRGIAYIVKRPTLTLGG